MDAIIANTCIISTLAVVTAWALVSAEANKESRREFAFLDDYRMFVCPPNICGSIRCDDIRPQDCPPTLGHIDPYGSFCRCCPKCVLYLEENDPCQITIGTPQTSTCRPGLICRNSICTKISRDN